MASADISTSRSFLSTSADGHLTKVVASGTYAECWGATTADVYGSGSYSVGGQATDGGSNFGISRGVAIFDTSVIPTDANITSAVLSIYVETDHSDTDFNFTIQSSATYPHNPMQASDYYYAWYGSADGGSRNTSEIAGAGYWNITLNDTGEGYINDAGYTRFMLRSSRDISATQPTGDEYITFSSRDQGESVAPKLYVTYEISAEEGNVFNYYFYGPYEDDGSVFNGTASVTLYPFANDTITFDLTADGTTSDYHSVGLEQQAVVATWNISSTANYTRVFYFTDDNTENVYVTVPTEDLPFYLYSFTVNDFEGVTNGYLENMLWIGGSMRVVERQPLNTINAQPFYMTWAQPYEMRVNCDEGTLDLGTFTALTETSQTIIIPYGAFDSDAVGSTVEVSAVRTNASVITASYDDPEDLTNWLYISIKHRASLSGNWTTNYSANTTSANSYSKVWDLADETTDYLVTIQVLRDGDVKTWSFTCPYARNNENPWSPLANLGTFGGTSLTLEFIPAVAIIIAVFLMFSFYHISASAWSAWGLAVFFTFMSWLPYDSTATPIALGFGAVLSVGITFGEFKKTERDV